MKGPLTRQSCTLAEAPAKLFDVKVKCVTALVFEQSGKTVIQPLVNGDESLAVRDLLQNDILEVWLPNGKSDPAQFDVSILKYEQLKQPSTMCGITGDRICLRNNIETIVSCEQCPLNGEGAED